MRETWRNTLPENVQRASAETVREQAGEAGTRSTPWRSMASAGCLCKPQQGRIGAVGS